MAVIIFLFNSTYSYIKMFGGTMHSISGQLFPKLNQKGLTPEELFSIPNINGDIRQNIQKFLAFCARNRQFTIQMFQLCFNSTYQQLNNQNKKKVAQYTIEALSNDEDALSDFLFHSPHTLRNSSEVSQKIEVESEENIETEAQRLFSDDSPNLENQEWENQPEVFEKFELTKLSLAHLSSKEINETCLGYIHKVYSSILRRQGKYVLEFFKENQDYLDQLFNNLQYPSISNIIALMLSSQDKTGQYQYQQLKSTIFQKLIDYAFTNISDSQKYQGFMMTIEQILNSTKQSYYEYFQDFKRCANILVSEMNLRKFYEKLKTSDEVVFGNAIWYLELILRRISNQNDDNDYYRQHENSEPTMKFEHQFLFKEVGTLTDYLEKSASYSSVIRVNYLCFLLSLLKLQKNDESKIQTSLFIKLLNYYLKETKTGMIKNYFYQMLDILINKASSEQIQQISAWLVSEQIIDNEVSSRISCTTNAKNNDLVSCFFLSILFHIENRSKGFIQKSGSNYNNALKDLNQIYKTKLADQVQDNFFEMDFVIPKKFEDNDKMEDSQPRKEGQKQMHVGRNNILIPSLNLPNRNENNENTKVVILEEPVQQFEFSKEPTRESVIQDLKNTIIELPSKFKLKKSKNTDKEEEKIFEIKQGSPPKQVLLEEVTKSSKQKISGFYVRHLILF